jgi:CheY-like chemotaxis protein
MAGRRQIVLVADDDAAVREAIAEALGSEGHDVVLAHDGRDALERLAGAVVPCAILLDWMMPGMNGEAFLLERERSAKLSRIPVYLISATHVPNGDPRVQGCLPKPFALDDLLALVASTCDASCADRCPVVGAARGAARSSDPGSLMTRSCST